MEINEYLLKLFRASKEMENLELFSDQAKLSRTEFRLLREIACEREQGREIISSELARRLGITRSAISQIVTKMEERGIVVRVASDTDKKIAYLRFSKKAIAVFEEQCRQVNEVMRCVIEELGEEKMDTFIALCEEFTSTFKRVHDAL